MTLGDGGLETEVQAIAEPEPGFPAVVPRADELYGRLQGCSGWPKTNPSSDKKHTSRAGDRLTLSGRVDLP